jgi:hypothetical protein
MVEMETKSTKNKAATIKFYPGVHLTEARQQMWSSRYCDIGYFEVLSEARDWEMRSR